MEFDSLHRSSGGAQHSTVAYSPMDAQRNCSFLRAYTFLPSESLIMCFCASIVDPSGLIYDALDCSGGGTV